MEKTSHLVCVEHVPSVVVSLFLTVCAAVMRIIMCKVKARSWLLRVYTIYIYLVCHRHDILTVFE